MFIFYYYIIILIGSIISNKVIILKFKEIIQEFNDTQKNNNYLSFILNNYLEYKTITKIKIGTPPKLIPLLINTNIKIFRMRIEKPIFDLNLNNYNLYIPSKSSSFKNISEILELDIMNSFQYSLINETIYLCIDDINCSNEIEIKKIQLFLENINNIKNNEYLIKNNYSYTYSYGELGFSTSESSNTQSYFFSELKNLGIINSIIITIEYTSEEEGLIYIGDYPHIFKSNEYNEDELMTSYTIPVQGYTSQLKLRINRLYIINKNEEYIEFENNIVFFNFGLGIILSTEEYYNKIIEIFFKEYIYLNICVENKINKVRNSYYIISCQKSQEFKIEEFPPLYLFKEEFRLTFELNYKDLFKEFNNIYYFLVVYFPFSNTNFELGKPFLKKYKFIYNGDSKTIHFYNSIFKNKKKEKINDMNINKDISNKRLILIYFIILILGIILMCVLILFVIYLIKQINQKRKLRTNELDDEFDYNITSIND